MPQSLRWEREYLPQDWIYEGDNTTRFVLGTKGENPLVCFGINPSTASPKRSDQTLIRVEKHAYRYGSDIDSWIMLNIYPQRATNPNDLHRECCPALKAENERRIAALIDGRALTLWAAWGGLISKRPYLLPLVQSIVALPALQNCTWVSRGKPTKDGHPHHPLYVKNETPFAPFDISLYNLNTDSP